ncbi:MAG: YlxR family protein [Leptolyngbya sp. SIO1D8]|nr:YlxR family protein [Leptolyngbya sp. SIO1D8]
MKPNHRRCVSCRAIAPKEAFWRIVRVYPTQTVQLDEGMGRSAYLCPKVSCLKAAQKKNRLGRSLRVSVPDDVYDRLWQRLMPSSTLSSNELFLLADEAGAD